MNKIKLKDLEEKAQVLAQAIDNKNLLIYSDNEAYSLAYYWKISFNENAKKVAFYNLLPEICHNEVEMFEDKSILENFYVLFIANTKLVHPKTLIKLETIKKILDNLKVSNSIVKFDDEDRLLIVAKILF